MGTLEIMTFSEEETKRLGELIGELLRGDEVILLTGELGTGKTTLIQGIAKGMGVGENPISPSFVLVREYKGKFPLFHVDLYRVEEDIESIGLEEYLGREGVVAVEWAEKGRGYLPEDALFIRLEHLEGDKRRITLIGKGEKYREIVRKVKERWSSQ